MAEHTTEKMPVDAPMDEKDVRELSSSPDRQHDVEVGQTAAAGKLHRRIAGEYFRLPSTCMSIETASPEALQSPSTGMTCIFQDKKHDFKHILTSPAI